MTNEPMYAPIMIYNAQNLAAKRLELAEARTRLREAEDTLTAYHVVALSDFLRVHDDDPKALGTNDPDRKRITERVLLYDTAYQEALGSRAAAQDAVDRLTATVEALSDLRRADELAGRLRLADAILAGGLRAADYLAPLTVAEREGVPF